MNRSRFGRRLGFESLEDRSLMAGNVTASVTNGVLNVKGDASINELRIRQLDVPYTGAWPGVTLEFSGLSSDGRNDSTINGKTGSVVLSGIKSGVNIDLGAGDDILKVSNEKGWPRVSNPSNLVKRLTVNLPGIVNITGGADRDNLGFRVVNHMQFSVTGGDGNDILGIAGSTFYDVTIGSRLDEQVPTGSDDVNIEWITVNGKAQYLNGSGAVLIQMISQNLYQGDLLFDLGNGYNSVTFTSVNETTIRSSTIMGKTTYVGGINSDSIRFDTGTYMNTMDISLGDGVDGFVFLVSGNKRLNISGGNGDDDFQLADGNNGLLDGGGGSDTIYLPAVVTEAPTRRNIEASKTF